MTPQEKNQFLADGLAGAFPREIEGIIAAYRMAQYNANPCDETYSLALDAALVKWLNSGPTERFENAPAMYRGVI